MEMTTNATPAFSVRALSPRDLPALYELRLRVLRPGRPPESAIFPGDDHGSTIHLGAFDSGDILVGIATLMDASGIQLRGMATDPAVRGLGAGAAIVAAAHALATGRKESLWCNARVSAVPFYEKQGWKTEGAEFDVPDVGPHFLMRWQGGS